MSSIWSSNFLNFKMPSLIYNLLYNRLVLLFVTGLLIPFFVGCTDGKVKISSTFGKCEEGSTERQCVAGSSSYVTKNSGGDISSTELSIKIPAGYYNGLTSVNVSDVNLNPNNILLGTSIFGIPGRVQPLAATCSATGLQSLACTVPVGSYWNSSVIIPAYAACTDNGLNSQACSTASSRYVTPTLGSGITTWTNSSGATTVSGSIPEAFYQAGTVISFTEPNLLASNILLGKSLFGVAGNVQPLAANCSTTGLQSSICTATPGSYWNASEVTPAYAACTDNGLNTQACSTVINRYVTPTLGSGITTWTNASGSAMVSGNIPEGFYPSGTAISFLDAALIAGNIRAGVSIFNVIGSYVGTGGGGGGAVAVLQSNMFRDRTVTQMSQDQEATTNAGTAYPNSDPGYRAVPRIGKDDDGYSGTGAGSVAYVDRSNWDTGCDAAGNASDGTGTGGPYNTVCKCGTTQATLAARIADCAAHGIIGSQATWNGAVKGNSGQGLWKLVSRSGAVSVAKGRELWVDDRTQLLWSSFVSRGINWCKASGSNNITGNPAAEVDPSGYCDLSASNTGYQNTSGQAVSACFEDTGSNQFSTSDVAIDNNGKVGLGLTSTPRVDWRLPTINDYKQADVDGIRFVMPEIPTSNQYEWSATVFAGSRDNSWVFNSASGIVISSSRSSNVAVRCVGR